MLQNMKILRNFEERLHQKRGVTEASGKKSTSRASLRELKIRDILCQGHVRVMSGLCQGYV